MHEQMHRKYLAPQLYPVGFSVEGSSDYNHDHYTTQNYPLISMYAWDKGTTYWFCQDPLYKVTEELDFTVHSTHKQWWWWQYVHVRPCMSQHTCGGQEKALQSFFPLSTFMGALGIKLKSSVSHSKSLCPLGYLISPQLKVLTEQGLTSLSQEGTLQQMAFAMT